MMANRLDVLFIDDDEDLAGSMAQLLRIFHDVRVALDLRCAVHELQQRPPQVVLCDLEMPPFRGDAILRMIEREYPHVRRILFTGSLRDEWAHLLDEGVAQAVVPKSAGLDGLLDATVDDDP